MSVGLALVLVAAVLLASGVPVAYGLGLAATIGLLLAVAPMPALATAAQRVATGVDSFALLAIPCFVLAGLLMERGGAARRVVTFARTLVGGLPGGLAHVHILASMLFGAVSGSAVASASAIGTAVGPHMVRAGYPRRFAAAVNVSAATTGLIIPPSNVLIVFAVASGGTSVAALFLAGYLPGLILAVGLMAAAAITAPEAQADALAPASDTPLDKTFEMGDAIRALIAALPSLGLIIVTVGGIVGGVFTATEAAAVAVAYALVLGRLHGELAWRDLPGILRQAATTTAVVMMLIGVSGALAWVLTFENLPQQAAEALLGLSDSRVVILLMINLLLLVVGTVLDMTPAVLLFTPIFLPVTTALGMDPVHFGIMLVLNLCIGLCTPPVGTVLFVGASVAGVPMHRLVRPLLPLYAAMVGTLLLVTFVPWLSLWLPRVFER